MKRDICGIFLILALCAAFAATWPFRGEWAGDIASATMKRPLTRVASWHYQLDDFDPARLDAHPADLLFVETETKNGKVPLDAQDVARLKLTPDGRRRLVIAFLPVADVRVGAHDEFSTASTSAPAWLGEPICATPQRYRVRYWLPAWRSRNYRAADSDLSRIIDVGFDGVYLDGIDRYRAYEKDRPSARREMIETVVDLGRTARHRKPGFLIVAQEAEELLDDPDYRLAVDAVGKERLVIRASATAPHEANGEIQLSPRLRHLRREGKPVFAVDYLLTPTQLETQAGTLRRRGLLASLIARMRARGAAAMATNPRYTGTVQNGSTACAPQTMW